jgi:hypothetical protein
MHDDRLSRLSDQELFEAIVAELDDPEVIRLRRIFLLMAAAAYVVAVAGITLLAGMGWAGVLAFSSTFVPSIVLARRIPGRRFARRRP